MQSDHMQPGDGGPGAGGAARARRALAPPYAVGSQPNYAPHQQQAPGFGPYPGGMSLPVGGAGPPPRYALPQAPQQPQQQVPMRSSYWQPSVGLDSGGFSKQQPAGGLELELGDILEPSGGAHTGQTSVGPATSAADMGVASFDANPFQNAANSAKGGFHAVAAGGSAPTSALGPNAGDGFLSDGTRTLATAVSRPGAEFAVFVSGPDEPDLTTRTLEEKNATCSFDGCPNRARVAQVYGKFCNRHVIVAPCGFPACREKAMAHDTMCKTHANEGKDALHEILKTRPNSVPVCHIFGCFKNDQGRGYCRGHEKLLMATGRLPTHISKRRLNSAYTMCSFPGCAKHSQRNHLCRTHGNRIMKQAEEEASRPGATESYEEVLSRLQKDIRRCTHATCTKNSQRDRLCTMHYLEKTKMQRDSSGGRSPASSASVPTTSTTGASTGASTGAGASSSPSIPAPAAATLSMCTTPGCTLPQVANDMCKYHAAKSAGKQATDSARAWSDIRAVERTHCGVQGCLDLTYTAGLCREHFIQQRARHVASQSRLDELRPFPTAVSPSNMANEAKQGLFVLSNKPQPNVGDGADGATAGSGGMPSSMSTSGAAAKCSNPMCVRESNGRDYCDACQSLFSPLVVSVGDGPAGASGYPFPGAGSAPVAGAGGGGAPCRVGNCNAPPVRARLCEVHFRAFQGGSLSVDQLKLESQERQRQREQDELAEAAAAAAAAVAETKQPSPTTAKGSKKYFCQVEGCEKQAQKRGLCKRHFRLQEGTPVSRTHKAQQLQQFQQHEFGDASFSIAMPPAGGGQVETPRSCEYPGCAQEAGGDTRLCLMHAKATFCWQPGCDNLVEQPSFCEYHTFRQRCAFENCVYGAERGMSGCASHAMAQKCRHDFCDKFAVGSPSEWCRVHQMSCQQSPCALCKLHSPPMEGQDENSNRSQPNIVADTGASSELRESRMA